MAGDTVYIRQGTYRVTEAEIMEHYTAGSTTWSRVFKMSKSGTGPDNRRGIKNGYTRGTIKESGNSTYEIFLRGGGRKGEIVFTKFIKRMRFFDTVESVLF